MNRSTDSVLMVGTSKIMTTLMKPSILDSLNILLYGEFYMQCLTFLRYEHFWRRHWMNAFRFPTTESKFLFLESITGWTIHGEHVGIIQWAGSSRSSGPSSSGSNSISSSQRSQNILINPPTSGYRPLGTQERSPGLGFASFCWLFSNNTRRISWSRFRP